MAKYELDGYTFETAEELSEARHEQEAIKYLESHADFNNVVQLTRLYNKLLDNNTLQTKLGIDFLTQLRGKILKLNPTEEKTLRPVPEPKVKKHLERKTAQKDIAQVGLMYNAAKKQLRIFQVLSGVLAVVILLMFVIFLNGKYSPYADYEEQLINKYSEWSDTLNDKEKRLNEQETKLYNIEREIGQRESDIEAKEQELLKKENDLKLKEEELNKKEENLK